MGNAEEIRRTLVGRRRQRPRFGFFYQNRDEFNSEPTSSDKKFIIVGT
jgi:hypothetical protein